MAAKKDRLSKMHELVAEVLIHELQKDREGEDIPASLIAQAISFLKNNGIDSVGEDNPALRQITKSLPFSSPDADEPTYTN